MTRKNIYKKLFYSKAMFLKTFDVKGSKSNYHSKWKRSKIIEDFLEKLFYFKNIASFWYG